MEKLFNVGDKFINYHGESGKITGHCECIECKARGFLEPQIKYDNGYKDDITRFDIENKFARFYSIGNNVYGNIMDTKDKEYEITMHKNYIKKLKKELENIRKVKGEKTMKKQESIKKYKNKQNNIMSNLKNEKTYTYQDKFIFIENGSVKLDEYKELFEKMGYNVVVYKKGSRVPEIRVLM